MRVTRLASVGFPVSVMDVDGKYIPNLRKEDFRLWNDGVEQQVAYFASTEQPFTVVLMIDTSGSTHFRLDEIHDAEELDALIYPVQFDTYQDMNVRGSWPGSRGGPSSPRPSIIGDILGSIIFGGGRGGGGWPGGGGPGSSRDDYRHADQYLRAHLSRRNHR